MDINSILSSLKLDAFCIDSFDVGNSKFYDIILGPNTSTKKFIGQIKELGFRLKSEYMPHVEILPKEGKIRLQVITEVTKSLSFFEDYMQHKDGQLNFFLGKDYYDNNIYTDITNNPHILLSGSTGSGKSVALHNFIANSLLQNDVELYLGDPKNVEFSLYENLDKVSYIAYTYQEHNHMIENLIQIMEQRFALLKSCRKTNIFQIPGFNKIIVVIDEIADLMLQDKKSGFFQTNLCRLAQKCRAAGIYLIIATQRPSVDIISGNIKANFPARISCKVSSKIDSKVVLDEFGAENLLGNGDAIIKSFEHSMVRFKFPFISPIDILARFA